MISGPLTPLKHPHPSSFVGRHAAASLSVELAKSPCCCLHQTSGTIFVSKNEWPVEKLRWGKGNAQLQPTLVILSLLRERRFTLQRHMLTEGLRPQPRVIELLPQTTPHCNISKGLIIAVSFTQFLLPCRLSGKITRHTNRQTSKHSLRKYRKHHNHTESNNQGYWNYQTEKLKQLWSVCEELK